MAKTKMGHNQLSRSYKFKKKTGKVKKRVDNNTSNEGKKARIVVRNLSFKVTEADIRQLYAPFGEIEEINLLRRPDGKLVGCGFVQFKNVEDASKAIFKTNKKDFLGRTINSEWAIPKSQFYGMVKKEEAEDEVVKKEEPHETEEESRETTAETDEIEVVDQDGIPVKNKKDKQSKKNGLSKAEQRKQYKLRKRQKRSRIVIRNLPFNVTEDVLKEHFHKYGNIEDLRILKKPNGVPTGCCFLQYDRVQSAAQAIHHENLKPLLDRPMVVDWAVAKDKFVKSQTGSGPKKEKDEIKEEKEDVVKEEEASDEESITEKVGNAREEDSDDSDSELASDNDIKSEDGSDSCDSGAEKDDKNDIEMELDTGSVTGAPHPKRISNDVSEGKTVFIKNVPFSATNEDLKACMEQYGPVFYALICMDRLTEHSKGTAFVKFRNVEDAEKCLAAGTELKLHDQILDPHRALHRKEVVEKNEEKKKKAKDSRNLYLVKEGVILASSPAAADVSAADMAKRLQLEKWKSQILRNLSMFVSKNRLVVQNLPPSLDDDKLRQIFKKHSNPTAVIIEARVMRDLKNIDANGVGKSKEYGFVAFTNHEDALKALRSINNNPTIFTRTKRPIVAFSIENRSMVKVKQKRMENSRWRNPLWKKRPADGEDQDENKQSPPKKAKMQKQQGQKQQQKPESQNNSKKAKRKNQQAQKQRQQHQPQQVKKAEGKKGDDGEEVAPFAGSTSKPGASGKHGKSFLRKQANLHNQNVKKQKKKVKASMQIAAKKREQKLARREPKPKQGSKKPDADEANFNKIVNRHRNKLAAKPASVKTKWFDS